MFRITRLIKKIWTLIDSLYFHYKWKMFWLSVLGIASGFLEGIGVTLLIPLFSFFVGSSSALGSSVGVKFFKDFFSRFGLSLDFKFLLLITVSIFLIKAVAVFAFSYLRTRIVTNYKTGTRKDIYQSFLGTNYSFLRKQKVGYLDAVLIAGIKQSSKLLEYLIGFILSVVSLITYLCVAFVLSPFITVVTLIFGIGFLVLYKPLVGRIKRYSKLLADLSKVVAHSMTETLYGIKTVKAFGVEKQVLASTAHVFTEIEEAEFKKQITKNFAKLSLEPFSVIFMVAVFSISYLYTKFDIVAFASIMYLINKMFALIDKIQSALHVIGETLPNAQEVLGAMREVKKHQPLGTGTKAFHWSRELRFDSVTFGYGSEKGVLREISFSVPRGTVLGIVGPSGAGKTTIVDLILRLLSPTEGFIALDDTNISDITVESWRKNIIYVAQDMFLRNDSIAENIRFYDETISDEEMIEVAKMANIYNLIMSLPKKFDTVIGERGTRLSGGERQRITLARALARKPSILILDEATSSLDAVSEGLIKEALNRLKGKITMIIIAHRPSTLEYVDTIIALDHGKIIERGTPNALLADPSSYFSKVSKQGNVAS
ncbi:MAG: hypothetical protein A2836_02210 [Candidatus Taylorbacteria bacterium RIFCSPHIGHO2_01_FULL_45_63]|uniref:ABC transporter ATP-binding protein n=1 Tax=Candidatus Taylorbacteria bacterium RIFCSPHIGHO2_02_FULL_45_35 TaxID=1802311 RepID=A0A1G2MQL3_9BACT|nr:MAG: hypothetical protein A2836_02210 [Candidatus Taylorbacteria bacterium RIFCSPHIGHO2_01_FULL_45_63]OHA26155.1 MAG: hypothetical protein A3D56_00440 [Candidatus Taylorbacteria bacterium RIFCSPHIGHO2_02_FULL_45_35]OHA32503.1 MAG: hypothetical protein A3A22_00640 [Candidatus Taylorbacteria bacterium RIFCSPLOWO2_01_FULL_45_34b]